MKRLKPVITAIALCGAVAACTPREVELWQDWHAQDPAAAEEFARNLNSNSSSNGGGSSNNNGGGGNNRPGDCDSYRDDMAAAGLPVSTFVNIAWRESRCNPNAWVVDSNDTGGGLFGFNFKGSLAGYWRNACGATVNNIRGNVDLQMRCAKVAYDQLGLQPWAGSA